MMCEPQVVIGADHDQFLAVDHDLGPLGVIQRDKVGIVAGFPSLGSSGELGALFKQVHPHPPQKIAPR